MFTKEDDFYKRDSYGNYILDKNGERVKVAIPKGKNISESEIWVGDYIYEDIDDNGVIDEKDRTYLGNPEPKFSYGFNNSFSYKGFDLNIFINGVYGNKVVNMLRKSIHHSRLRFPMSMSRMPVRHKYSASLLPMLTIITV